MTKKNICLVTLLVILLGTYVFCFTDWFKPRVIKIGDTARPSRRLHAKNDLPYVLFILEGRYQLTDIKVVPLADYQKNSETPPVWHLVSDSGSVPLKEFAYGQHIRGMDPAFEGDEPQPLQTNVVYRLLVASGSVKGSHDFQIR
jgi:hypothetical protein